MDCESTCAHNEEIRVYITTGDAYWRAARYEVALEHYGYAKQLDPSIAVVHRKLGATLAVLGQHEEAIKACNKAIELDPTDTIAYNNRGRVHRDLGDTVNAAAYFQFAKEISRLQQQYEDSLITVDEWHKAAETVKAEATSWSLTTQDLASEHFAKSRFPASPPNKQESRAYGLPDLIDLDHLVASKPTDISDPPDEVNFIPILDRLRELVSTFSKTSGSTLDALIARFGLCGKPPITLEAAGNIAGLSRERIRQLESRVKSRKAIDSSPAILHGIMPGVDLLIGAISDRLPDYPDPLKQAAVEIGVSDTPIHPLSVLAIADFCGVPVKTWSVKNILGEMTVVKADGLDPLPPIILAKKLCSASGVTNHYIVAGLLGLTDVTDLDKIHGLFRGFPGFRFLDGSWFWNPTAARNRLKNILRKMLSVSSTITIEEARVGIGREYQYRNSCGSLQHQLTVQPLPVLRRFVKQHPDFSIDSQDNVVSMIALDYRRELGEAVVKFVDVLRSVPGGVIDRTAFAEKCKNRGVNNNTFNVYSSYSPILKHVDFNIWGLLGEYFDPAAIQMLKKKQALKPRVKRVVDSGLTDDGHLRLGILVPKFVQHLVFGIPAEYRRFVTAEHYEARDVDGSPCGTIGISVDYGAYGFGSYLRQSGAEEGDTLVVEFNDSDKGVCLRLVHDWDIDGRQIDDESRYREVAQEPELIWREG